MALKAVQAFNATHQRAKTLWNLHSSGTAGRPKKEKEDLLRAAIILALAAVDSYFHDKILERLTPYLKSKEGKNLPGELIKFFEQHVGVTGLLPLFYKNRPHRHIHTAVKNYQADRTFQKPDKIENALKMLGISDFWFKVARKMGHGFSKNFLKNKIGQYAARRDKIVHEGDWMQSGKLNPITRRYVEDCLRFTKRYIEAADNVIDVATGG